MKVLMYVTFIISWYNVLNRFMGRYIVHIINPVVCDVSKGVSKGSLYKQSTALGD